MANNQDLIDFDVIETQKENIQSLASGRSAKSLARIFSPCAIVSPPSNTQNLNDAIRAEYEKELLTIDDSDDPLDIYDRYVRWTLNAYPSSQATPASQLLPLLERTTKIFLSSEHYKNDPRYLKLWLHYIRLFSDAPRETFAYLARHGIAAELALFYEEFAAWLEGADRWTQAEEVYMMGVERGARPAERLMRKFIQFQKRAGARQVNEDEPKSPALPAIRPALAAKVDPFSTAPTRIEDSQSQARTASAAAPRRQKLQVFSDGAAGMQSTLVAETKGWEMIGSISERKKENTVAARPWVGEKLNVGSRQNVGAPKMPIFKDQPFPNPSVTMFPEHHLAREQEAVNKNSGKRERIVVNLEKAYPNPHDTKEEYCFEEIRAIAEGLLEVSWGVEEMSREQDVDTALCESQAADITTVLMPIATLNNKTIPSDHNLEMLNMNDENRPPSSTPVLNYDVVRRVRREDRTNRTRKLKVREIKNETQTIQTNLSSPQGPKLRRKRSAEPTMTVHTKAATDAIYEIFNEPLRSTESIEEATDSEDDSSDEDDDDYVSAGESTGTGHISESASEYGENTRGINVEEDAVVDAGEDSTEETTRSAMTTTEHEPESVKHSQGHLSQGSDATDEDQQHSFIDKIEPSHNQEQQQPLSNWPSSPIASQVQHDSFEIAPLADSPEKFRRRYRSTAEIAHNRLPFMTPIVEKTESSLGALTHNKENDYFNSKTPCPKGSPKTPTLLCTRDEVWSSPFQEDLNEQLQHNVKLIELPVPSPKSKELSTGRINLSNQVIKDFISKGPIVKDVQCNPMDEVIRGQILVASRTQLLAFEGYHEHNIASSNRKTEIRKFGKTAAALKGNRTSSDKSGTTSLVPPILQFSGAERQYVVKRELGAGAYAPVYLVEGFNAININEHEGNEQQEVMSRGRFIVSRRTLEAMKMEEPPSPWEFFMIRTAHRRLGISRATQSIVQAYEMHLFKEEGYLIEEYRDQGTLLDLVNGLVQQNNGSAVDEQLAMFFMIELFRTVEALHGKNIIHCDLKADNVLVRLTATADELSTQYCPNGTGGWTNKGITLIDLGRSIDMRAFRPDVQFTADWETSATDCAEMREMRPWTYQADYFGLAAIAHTMLFGRYIETVMEKGVGIHVAGGRTYKLKDNLKRYWHGEIWGDVFALLLNPVLHVDLEEGQRMPCLQGMRGLREKMETYLVASCEKGVGLKALIRKAELLVANRKKV